VVSLQIFRYLVEKTEINSGQGTQGEFLLDNFFCRSTVFSMGQNIK